MSSDYSIIEVYEDTYVSEIKKIATLAETYNYVSMVMKI